jgi:hypothetical protein
MSIFFSKTAIGFSHLKSGKRCQDYSASYCDGERTIVTACDGHGGNVYVRSHLGSKFASDAVIDVLRGLERTAFYKNKKETVAEKLRLNVLCRWNSLVEEHMAGNPLRRAELAGLTEAELLSLRRSPVKAYGTTLNAAMIMGSRIITVSLGDGGCFLLKGGVCFSPFPEEEDEPVANITYSLCQDDAFSHLTVAIHELSGYDGAVVCTDGMINPFQNLNNFGESLVKPAVSELITGKAGILERFVTDVGLKLGTGDDVSLGIVMKGKFSARAYSNVGKN